MNVLVLHQHFNTPYTGGAIRSYYLAKALVDAGINVRVITGSNRPEYAVDNVDGIEVHYLPVAYENRFGFYRRGLSFLKYVTGSIKLAKKFRDIDVCYAMSVPLTVGIAAMRIKSRLNVPFIFEVGDLWPDAPVEMGFVKNPLLKNVLYRLEKMIYRSAQSIVALSPTIKKAIEEKIADKAIHVISNMSDTEFFRPEKKDTSLISRFGVQNKFVVSYTGAIGVANGLEHMIACAHECSNAGLPVHFIICGEGGEKLEHESTIKSMQLDNISIVPFTNREGVRQILNITDATFVSYKPYKILETGSPNKYFDGLAAGKMIVVNFNGWIREEISSVQAGAYIDPKKPSDFVQKITPYLESDELLNRCQRAARQLAERNYSRKKITSDFVNVIRHGGRLSHS